jgi:hypothetical protein
MVLEVGDGGVLEDGLTDTDLIGDGVVVGGEVLALVLGALTINIVRAASIPYWECSCALTIKEKTDLKKV